MSKIEIGGGRRPCGDGYQNLDNCDGADIRCDIEHDRWPLADDTVEDVYANHVLQRVVDTKHILHEIVRVCRVGARVEIRVPHWLQSMALCGGQHHTISPMQVKHWSDHFILDWWEGCTKRLKLHRIEYIPGETFGEAKDLFGWLSDEQIMRMIPDSCHEVRYHMETIPNV